MCNLVQKFKNTCCFSFGRVGSRVCMVSIKRSGKLIFIWTETLRFGMIFIGSMDLTLISYQTIISIILLAPHTKQQTPSRQQNRMESVWRACMRQIIQNILLFRFTSVAVIYWFIEMALIFERNANLQFYTFDKLRKLTAWFIRHKYKYINQLTRVFVYFIFFYRILFSTLIFESINERKSAFIWFCFLRKQIGFVNEFKLYQLMSSHYRP